MRTFYCLAKDQQVGADPLLKFRSLKFNAAPATETLAPGDQAACGKRLLLALAGKAFQPADRRTHRHGLAHISSHAGFIPRWLASHQVRGA